MVLEGFNRVCACFPSEIDHESNGSLSMNRIWRTAMNESAAELSEGSSNVFIHAKPMRSQVLPPLGVQYTS